MAVTLFSSLFSVQVLSPEVVATVLFFDCTAKLRVGFISELGALRKLVDAHSSSSTNLL